ncbi:peptidase, partial [Rhizoctonia solani]
MRTAFIVSALALIIPVLGAPTVVPIIKHDGPVKPNSYIIKFKDRDSGLRKVEELIKASSAGSSIVYDYHPLFSGAAVDLKPGDLELVQGISEIDYIEPDYMVSLSDHSEDVSVDALPSVAPEFTHSPVSRDVGSADGAGVMIYGIDTGIYTEHSCFGGRASWGKTFGGYQDQDGHGHGTHTAATAVGSRYGLATSANVIAVKVLSDSGSGSNSDVIAGVNYAYHQFMGHGKPSIVTMSLGGLGPPNSALNEAIGSAIDSGLHFTIAAGNSNVPADGTSPANVKEANTIGAVDSNKNNKKASFSNYGSLIDVWAPGVSITSAWIGSPNAENTISGTSMATPFVAGILACAISGHGQKSPAELSEELKKHATPDVKFDAADLPAKLVSTDRLAQKW